MNLVEKLINLISFTNVQFVVIINEFNILVF